MTPEFIHLHVHSQYSLLEGAMKVQKLVDACVAQNMPAIALTDTNNLFGGMDISYACAKAGVQPILGTQLLLKEEMDHAPTAREEINPLMDKIVLLVQNDAGYANLLKIFNLYYMGADKQTCPHLTLSELEAHQDGLIVLSGGAQGIFGRYVLAGQVDKAENLLLRLQKTFGDRLYMEIMRHGMDEEIKTEAAFLSLAYQHHVPLVATNDVLFAKPETYEAHDALLCIADKTYVDVENRRKVTPEHYFKSAAQMKELFADIPEAIANTVQIARRCGHILTKRKAAFPQYDCGGLTEDDLLEKKAHEGLIKRMENRSAEDKEKYSNRMTYELGVIKQMGFPGYFLIVSDFIQWSKAHGIPVGPGRGSGAGSVVAWALTITDIDPLKFNLLFERFLNPERVSMPDFDVDFCQERRGETIRYVQEKYGFDHVAQIVTFGQLQAKAVIRDVGRVLQIAYPVVDRLSKLVPNGLNANGKPYALKEVLEIEPAFSAEAARDPQIKRLLDYALQLEGLYRNTSTHAAGVVIGHDPLDMILPIYKDPDSDMPVTQYNMKFVEDASLIKFDFLGLKTLTVLAKSVQLIKQRGIELDLINIPLDDTETFKLLSDADTSGVFQFESSGMRKILKDMHPDKIEDLVAIVALYRPGPMGNIPSYIARKHGTEKPDYLHPLLENILKETYGIMIYQEQVMQIAQAMAGYSLGGADLLRRAMGKKKKEEMVKQRVIFVEGAAQKGVTKEKANEVFDLMEKFASYGFNKSHAAAYAFISYQTAYLKAHYPVEFMAATMSLDKTDTDKLGFFKREVTASGTVILPPDVNKSEVDFSVEDGKIRYALSAVRNVGEGAMQALVAERKKNGAFKDVMDFVTRVDSSVINKRCLENLIKSGALECLDTNRAKLFFNLEKLVQYAGAIVAQKNSAQIGLFGEAEVAKACVLQDVPEWPALEKLEMEASAIGFYLSAHPLDSYASSFEHLRITPSSEIAAIVDKAGSARLRLVGIVNEMRERISQKTGNKFAFITASDTMSAFDMMCFSETLLQSRELLKSGQPLIFSVQADKKEDEVRLLIQAVESLNTSIAKVSRTLVLYVDSDKSLPTIRDVLDKDADGKGRVLVVACVDGFEVEIALEKGYALSAETVQQVRSIPAVLAVKQL